eukprot:GILI01005612.1.p1 GENE.GILI01005612.1~~GILI01005612.1.p1  ORF type:complete len:572 (-),score=168.06 GILI01005612.1:254-1969(-)
MATQQNNNDTKKAAGYFKEKFTIGLSRVTGDEVTRAIMKTTSHMLKAPNEKHLDRLIRATHGHYSEEARQEGGVGRYIIEELEKRSHTHNWIVVLKTMLVFHAFMIDGSDEVNKYMQRNRNLFAGRSIKDLADSPDGAAQQRFIEFYTRYLEERNVTQMRIDLEVRIESSEYLTALKMMPMGVLAQALGQLLQQLECIANIPFREEIINNFATLEAHTRLINDGAHLYAFISDRMVYALEHFEELDSTASKQTWLTLYKRYIKCIRALAKFFDSMRRSRVTWGSIVIPQIKEFPDALLTKLEDDVSKAESATSAGTKPTTDEVPEVEDISTLLAAEEKLEEPKEETPAQPPTVNSRIKAEATAETDLFGGPAEAPPIQPPVKPKPPTTDLDDLFGAPSANHNTAASATAGGMWGSGSNPPAQQQRINNDFDIFGAPPQQQSQQWAAPTGTAGSSSSSATVASPWGGNNLTTANATTANTAAPNAASSSSPVPFHRPAVNIFASDDFAPINNNSMTPATTTTAPTAAAAFDPFGNPPRENIFASNNTTNNGVYGAQPQQPQRPKNDMDDLFN